MFGGLIAKIAGAACLLLMAALAWQTHRADVAQIEAANAGRSQAVAEHRRVSEINKVSDEAIAALEQKLAASQELLADRAETQTALLARSDQLLWQLQEARDASTVEVRECLGLPLPDPVLCVVRGDCPDTAADRRDSGRAQGREDFAAEAPAAVDRGALVRWLDMRRGDRAHGGVEGVISELQRGQGGRARLARPGGSVA